MSSRGSITTAVRVALGASLLFSGHAISAEIIAAANVAPGNNQLDTLDAVLVTARNRVESAQDVPIPVTVLDSTRLETFGIDTVWDLEFYTPTSN